MPIVINRLKHVGKRRLQQVILDVGISVGTLLVLVVVLACVFRQRRRIKANKENQGMPQKSTGFKGEQRESEA